MGKEGGGGRKRKEEGEFAWWRFTLESIIYFIEGVWKVL